MSTIMPKNELVRKAVQWIAEEQQERENISLKLLIQEASERFNLGPLDESFLLEFFSGKSEPADNA